MQNVNNSPFCLYRYDPLNRLCDCTLLGQESARRFYQKDRLATEISGAVQHSIMLHADQLLAQQQRQSDTVETSLLATDQQRSVLNVLTASTPQPVTHTPYGHRPLASGLLSLLGFNGERPDPVTGCYLLGNGYRAFNPVLMRFNSPDSWSPFGKGGLNAYAYCVGDPVNQADPTGHFSFFPKGYNPFKAIQKRLAAWRKPSPEPPKPPVKTSNMTDEDILTHLDEYMAFHKRGLPYHPKSRPTLPESWNIPKNNKSVIEGSLHNEAGPFSTNHFTRPQNDPAFRYERTGERTGNHWNRRPQSAFEDFQDSDFSIGSERRGASSYGSSGSSSSFISSSSSSSSSILGIRRMTAADTFVKLSNSRIRQKL